MESTLKITQMHPASDKKRLNEEWLELINEGEAPFNTEACALTTAIGGGRQRDVTTIKAGLVVHAGERVRLVSGSSGKKSHGDPPAEEGVRNFHLFLKVPYLDRPGVTVRLVNRQRSELSRAVFGSEEAKE